MDFIHGAASVIGAYGLELGAGAVGTLAAGVAIGGLGVHLLVRMPADHLNEPTGPSVAEPSGWSHVAAKCGRNVLGAALITTGTMLALPSIPPGKSLIVIGLLALDFRGKRRLERRILGRPSVLRAVNRIRARFGRSPLWLDDGASPPRARQLEPC